MKSKVSIIVPVFNAIDHVLSFEESNLKFLLQYSNDVTDFELIFIDGESVDGTLDELYKLSEKYNFIHLFSEKDEGIYDAMNKGIQYSNSEFVYFLGMDDVLLPGFFNMLEKLNSEYDIFYGYVNLTSSGLPYKRGFNFKDIVKENVCHQSCFYNKKILLEKPYELKYKILSDWASNIFFSKNASSCYFDFSICKYNDQDGVSSCQVDTDFRNDRIKIIYGSYGFFGVLNFFYLMLFYKLRRLIC
ncbi:glycosyltransferase [Vibrio parahaemolyticus]|nr:glycosyltransferase [Vibrio vulnificus]EHR1008861.1 glycosyltransferase [Vibrio parahaemolyticus]EGQ7934017.1 glycosyltransferase [Vibrio vulnificus]EIU6824621.1 glycosyltransferase [Vibrio parahaemolyticus]EIX4889844.1 glycosyltransferase [Vibrio vulnificus]